jgi:prepilin-type N-terminal cleavage/methylation domain-containing protein
MTRDTSGTRLRNHLAFSLVELSIVLVILGLLVGGVLSGQSLIRAAELRSNIADMSRHQAAFQSFRDKYFALPGDMANATQFWGTDTVSACSTTPVAGDRVGKTATCDGNGNGQIQQAAPASPEMFRVWQHLANAGLIEGSYTGVAGTFSAQDHDPGINAPALKGGNSFGVSVYYLGSLPAGYATAYLFEGDYGNAFGYGYCNGYDCVSPGIKPEDAWNIDTKLDDGKPGTGKIITRVSCAVAGCLPNCNSATTNAAGIG